MQLIAELIGKFEGAGDCAKLLYVPPDGAHTFRRTRRYQLEFDGSEEKARSFVESVLGDEISHEIRFGGDSAFGEADFFLDYGMKPTALDHEKETVLAYHAELENAGFEIQKLKITTRLYVFGDIGPEPFVRDIVNPAVHVWEVSS